MGLGALLDRIGEGFILLRLRPLAAPASLALITSFAYC